MRCAGVSTYTPEGAKKEVSNIVFFWERPHYRTSIVSSYPNIQKVNLRFKDRVTNILGSDGVISRALENYELRPQQLKMAQGICESIEGEKHLIIEAGTGVGKSLAYLVPFIIYATENDKKVIVSTNTKTLQQQLYEKDLPFLKQSLNIEFEYALCLGTENYLCIRRLHSEFTPEEEEKDEK